jgi:DAPG hydrolase PhiG domain
MAQRWTSPQPLPIAWPLKPLGSAQTTCTRLPDGRLELTIKHDLLSGVTREMLSWWFRRIDGTMEYLGRQVPRYRVWHPRDHIFYRDLTLSSDGTGSAGTRRHIVEAFAENPNYLVNIVDRVAHLDETGILLVTERAGLSLGPLKTPLLPLMGNLSTLQHEFISAPQGTRYESRMLVGADSLIGRLGLNRHVLPRVAMSDAMGRAWLRHNVEEVGNFERFLPPLYEQWLIEGDTAFERAGQRVPSV